MAKKIIGKVVSNKMDKTVVISVESTQIHPLYKKRFTTTTRFKAHDEANQAQVGDVVEITETRPLSAQKHHTVSQIIQAAPVKSDAKDDVEEATK